MRPFGKIFGSLTKANRSPLQRKDLGGKMLAAWSATQGLKIAEARGKPILTACRHEAGQRAIWLAWFEDAPRILLTIEEIDECESRAVSQARMTKYGPAALRTNDNGKRWLQEIADVRSMLRAGNWPEGRA